MLSSRLCGQLIDADMAEHKSALSCWLITSDRELTGAYEDLTIAVLSKQNQIHAKCRKSSALHRNISRGHCRGGTLAPWFSCCFASTTKQEWRKVRARRCEFFKWLTVHQLKSNGSGADLNWILLRRNILTNSVSKDLSVGAFSVMISDDILEQLTIGVQTESRSHAKLLAHPMFRWTFCVSIEKRIARKTNLWQKRCVRATCANLKTSVCLWSPH